MADLTPPFADWILAEATKISPNRNRASDGIVGDPAHASRISDHNPSYGNYPGAQKYAHAVDITHDVSGSTPDAIFNAHAEGEKVRKRCQAGIERRVKYLVSHNFVTKRDIIASPPYWNWRDKASYDHASHLHVSFYDTYAVEHSVVSFWRPTINSLIKEEGGAMDLVRTPSGQGYYIVSSDGGVYCYGDANFFGSMGGKALSAPVVDIAVRPKNDGYMLVGRDGAVYCFGAAPYLGNLKGVKLAAPIVGCEFDKEGDGYWLLGADGGVFTFGKTAFYGSAAGKIKYP